MSKSKGNMAVFLLSAVLCMPLCACASTGAVQGGNESDEVDFPQSEAQEATAQEPVSQDPIVGYWKILTSTIDGEEHSLWDVTTAYAQFKDDGTWVLTLGDETYNFVWMASDENEDVPYYFTLADQAWGGTITDDIDTETTLFEGDILLMGQISNATENNMTLVRVTE